MPRGCNGFQHLPGCPHTSGPSSTNEIGGGSATALLDAEEAYSWDDRGVSDGGSNGDGGEDTNYRMAHTAPGPEFGSALHDIDGVMPDICEHPEWYDYHEDDISAESIAQIRAAKGNPDAEVTIYRSVPDASMGIRTGDWVTLSRKYAERHGFDAEDPDKDWPVIEMRVKASELWSDGNDPNEFGWHAPA